MSALNDSFLNDCPAVVGMALQRNGEIGSEQQVANTTRMTAGEQQALKRLYMHRSRVQKFAREYTNREQKPLKMTDKGAESLLALADNVATDLLRSVRKSTKANEVDVVRAAEEHGLITLAEGKNLIGKEKKSLFHRSLLE